jgi:hypothetical protein
VAVEADQVLLELIMVVVGVLVVILPLMIFLSYQERLILSQLVVVVDQVPMAQAQFLVQ